MEGFQWKSFNTIVLASSAPTQGNEPVVAGLRKVLYISFRGDKMNVLPQLAGPCVYIFPYHIETNCKISVRLFHFPAVSQLLLVSTSLHIHLHNCPLSFLLKSEFSFSSSLQISLQQWLIHTYFHNGGSRARDGASCMETRLVGPERCIALSIR